MIFTNSDLFLFGLYSLNIIGLFEIELKEYHESTTLQINSDECLITVNENKYLLNLKISELN